MENGTAYKVRGKVLYVQMPAEVDHHSSREMKEEILKIRKARTVSALVFDFAGTDFMDSAGIGMLLGRYKEMTASGGEVYIRHAGPRVARILEMSGICRIIGDWDHREEKGERL